MLIIPTVVSVLTRTTTPSVTRKPRQPVSTELSSFIALTDSLLCFTDQGKSVTVTITDRCTGCAEFDLDFSPSAFSQLADQSVGRIHGMTWHFDD